MKLLIGSAEYVNAVNQDFQIEIDLENKFNVLNEDILTEIIDESIQFNVERSNCSNYLIYGKIENLIDDSLSANTSNLVLNDSNYSISLGYVYGYEALTDYQYNIISTTGNNLTVIQNNNFLKDDIVALYYDANTIFIKKVIDSDVNLVTLDSIPSGITVTNYKLIPSVAQYKRIYSSLYNNNFLKFYNSAFSVNIFNDPITQFNTYKNINLSGLTDVFGLPATDIIINTNFSSTTTNNYYKSTNDFESNVNVIDVIQYDLNNILITPVDSLYQRFTYGQIDYKIIPWIDLIYQCYSTHIVNVTSGTSFDYPSYAFIFSDGDITYKTLLPLGYMEENVNGVNYPFMNNIQYLFTDIKFIIRRYVPIYDYTNTSLLNSDIVTYNDTLITATIGTERLC